MEKQVSAALTGEALVPTSIPFPIFADGESIDKGRAARSWPHQLMQLLAIARTENVNYTSATADLTRVSSLIITAYKGDVTVMVEAVGPRIFNRTAPCEILVRQKNIFAPLLARSAACWTKELWLTCAQKTSVQLMWNTAITRAQIHELI